MEINKLKRKRRNAINENCFSITDGIPYLWREVLTMYKAGSQYCSALKAIRIP